MPLQNKELVFLAQALDGQQLQLPFRFLRLGRLDGGTEVYYRKGNRVFGRQRQLRQKGIEICRDRLRPLHRVFQWPRKTAIRQNHTRLHRDQSRRQIGRLWGSHDIKQQQPVRAENPAQF
ncbi:MAG: hypothetical protein ABSD57_00070 [Verrucomicrobiota bacterium]